MDEQEKAVAEVAPKEPARSFVTEAQKSVPSDPTEVPSWLKSRLEDERNKVTKGLLQELGVGDISTVKSALAALKQMEDEKKTTEEKLRSEVADLQLHKARAQQLEQVIAAKANDEFSKLSAEEQDAVKHFAGDDPAKVLEAIPKVKGLRAASAAPKLEAPISAGATTASPKPSPAPTAAVTDNVLAKYENLLATNEWAAKMFLAHNFKEITRLKNAR